MSTTAELPPTSDQQTLRFAEGARFNIAAESKKFDCKFIEPGIVSYKDQGGGIELLRKETIDRCMDSVVGNPLIVDHTYITAGNRTDLEQGIVNAWSYNAEDGWYYVSGEADTPEVQDRMRRGERPSCGYRVKKLGPGGVYHGIRYDAEILDIEFNHLAVVNRPRYEHAEFRLNAIATVSNQTMNVFKFLKKLVTRENGADGKSVESTKVESHEVSGETEIEIDGKLVKLNNLAETYMTETKAAVVRSASGHDEVEIDGKNVKVNELVETYRKARCNGTPEHEKKETKAEEKAEHARENAAAPVVDAPAADAPAADAPAAQETRDNSAFIKLSNASLSAAIPSEYSTTSDSLAERCARGAKRY